MIQVGCQLYSIVPLFFRCYVIVTQQKKNQRFEAPTAVTKDDAAERQNTLEFLLNSPFLPVFCMEK